MWTFEQRSRPTMRYLLVLSILTGVRAYYEPGDLACNCSVSGDPVVSTFDGSILLIIKEQKTLIARWDDGTNDPCKFQLRAVTQKEIGAEEGSVYLEWIGFGFDAHPSAKKFERNVLIGQNFTFIKQRGRGFRGAELHPLPFAYFNTGVDVEVMLGPNMKAIHVRSNTCPFAIDFHPDDRETKFNLYVGEKYRDNTMVGMCGNCNGVHEDDYRTCPNATDHGHVTHDDDKFFVISDSCKEGKHQGWGYTGGFKV